MTHQQRLADLRQQAIAKRNARFRVWVEEAVSPDFDDEVAVNVTYDGTAQHQLRLTKLEADALISALSGHFEANNAA